MKNQEVEDSLTHTSLCNLSNYEKQFYCPINMTLMQNPTITACGHTFDKNAIQRYLLVKKQCPICRKEATVHELRPIFSLKNIINTYKESLKANINQDPVLDIRKMIDQYYEQAQKKIKQSNINKVIGKIPQLGHKINLYMNDKQIFQFGIFVFNMFKIRASKSNLKIIRSNNTIKLIQDNYLIVWHDNEKQMIFSEYQKNETNINGYVLHIIEGKFIFKGQCRDGKVNGKGKQCFSEGTTYQGDYKDGTPHGKGKYSKADGSIYQGDYINGLYHGKGKYYFANGATYQGDYEQGKATGKGILRLIDGAFYQGSWQHDQKHGKGKSHFADGGTYQGDYKNGKPNGKGKQQRADGATYQGDWEDGNLHGKGKYCWADGSTYQGDWKHGRKHGKGNQCYANGNIYQGDHIDNFRHGQGKMVDKNITKIIGLWQVTEGIWEKNILITTVSTYRIDYRPQQIGSFDYIRNNLKGIIFLMLIVVILLYTLYPFSNAQ